MFRHENEPLGHQDEVSEQSEQLQCFWPRIDSQGKPHHAVPGLATDFAPVAVRYDACAQAGWLCSNSERAQPVIWRQIVSVVWPCYFIATGQWKRENTISSSHVSLFKNLQCFQPLNCSAKTSPCSLPEHIEPALTKHNSLIRPRAP